MRTTDVWTYRDTLDTTRDVIGYDVEAKDGSIGKVDEASKETSRHYLVVDTGFWIFGKKRMIPAGVVQRVDHDDRTVHVTMTKDEIKGAPDLDETNRARDDAFFERHGGYYGSYGDW